MGIADIGRSRLAGRSGVTYLIERISNSILKIKFDQKNILTNLLIITLIMAISKFISNTIKKIKSLKNKHDIHDDKIEEDEHDEHEDDDIIDDLIH